MFVAAWAARLLVSKQASLPTVACTLPVVTASWYIHVMLLPYAAWFSSHASRQTDRCTNRQTNYNTLQPYQGEVIKHKICTIGQMHCRANVITKDDIIAGWKLRIFGYMSIGDSV